MSLVSAALRVEALDDAALDVLLAAVAKPDRATRWVVVATETGCEAVWPPDGTHVSDTATPVEFLRRRGEPGVALSAAAAASFLQRFPDATDPVRIWRVAGFVAPVLPDLLPELEAVGYQPVPSPKAQRILSVVTRFFPKAKAVALRVRGSEPFGLYAEFDAARRLCRIVGAAAWPTAVRHGGDLSELKVLGAPVEVGIDLTPSGFDELLAGGHNRAGFARMVAAGDLRFAPAPMALRLALKAARIA